MIGSVCEHGTDVACCPFCLLHQVGELQRQINDMKDAIRDVAKDMMHLRPEDNATNIEIERIVYDLNSIVCDGKRINRKASNELRTAKKHKD